MSYLHLVEPTILLLEAVAERIEASDGKRLIKEWMKLAIEQGWTVEKTGGGHWKFKPPTGPFVIAPSSPSDHRSVLNLRSELRRKGLQGV